MAGTVCCLNVLFVRSRPARAVDYYLKKPLKDSGEDTEVLPGLRRVVRHVSELWA